MMCMNSNEEIKDKYESMRNKARWFKKHHDKRLKKDLLS